MPLQLVLLLVVSFLIYMGIGQSILDRLYLTNRSALFIIVIIILSTFLLPDFSLGNRVSISVGGGIIPILIVIYILKKTRTSKERKRGIITAVASGLVMFIIGYLLPSEPEDMFLNLNLIYGIVAGTIAYILGRSRRGAFIAGILGVMISDFLQLIVNLVTGVPGKINFGGAGALDTTVLAGFIAVILVEFVGEFREKMIRLKKKNSIELKGDSFTSMLGKRNREERKDSHDKKK